jgi:hypothetical protein
MIQLSPQTRIYISVESIDFRCPIGTVQDELI